MKINADSKLTIILVLLVAFQAYVALYRGAPTGDGSDQEQVLLQHTDGEAPSRAHGEGDHQRFGGRDGQPSGLYQVNAPPGLRPSSPPGNRGNGAPEPASGPANAGGDGPPPAPGVALPGAPPLPDANGSGSSEAAAGPQTVFDRLESKATGTGALPVRHGTARAVVPGKSSHQPDATERLLLGIVYLEQTRHAINHLQAKRILGIVKTSEANKEAIPHALQVFDETLSEEQKNLVESRRAQKFKSKKPLPPGEMMPLLRKALRSMH